MSRATALVSVAQQLSISAGVAIGALVVELAMKYHGGSAITAEDFQPAFLVVSAIAATSVLVFLTLPHDAGAAMANRVPLAAPDASDQRVG
jgi:Na+(H+)/acetate symporter ActP